VRKEVRDLIPELETLLLEADVGVATTKDLIDSLKQTSIKKSDEAVIFLKEKILKMVTPASPFMIPGYRPFVIFFVGVNGTGKTTTVAKMAYWLKNQNLPPLLVGGDTFRAAATEQLRIWADRLKVDFVGGGNNADPSSVVFDGIVAARARGVDAVLVDTSGRLHTKAPLMEELKKSVRSAEKALAQNVHEIFLVLDATIGQNALAQAMTFKQVLPLTGIILAKYDSAAKGGILLAITRETGLPLRFVGTGEKMEDLTPFNPQNFVDELFLISR